MVSEVQSVRFDRRYWTTAEARTWLKKHDFKALKRVHKTDKMLRYRIKDPELFKSFTTKNVKLFVQLIIGFK